MSSHITRLQKLLDRLQEVKDEVSSLSARKEILLKKLKEEYGCNTLDEAQEMLDQLTEDNEKQTEEINTKYKALMDKVTEEGLV